MPASKCKMIRRRASRDFAAYERASNAMLQAKHRLQQMRLQAHPESRDRRKAEAAAKATRAQALATLNRYNRTAMVYARCLDR